MEQNENYKRYMEIQERERQEIVNKIIILINNPNHTLSPADAEETLSHIESNRLIAKDFNITKELFKILLSELERVKRQGHLFEIVNRAYEEKKKKHECKLVDCQKRLQNIFKESEEEI